MEMLSDTRLSQQPAKAEAELETITTEMPSNLVTNSEPNASKSSQSRAKLPDPRLLGNREDYLRYCVPLYEASVKGDWKTARGIITEHREVVRCSITENYETALHIAASAKSTESMEDFVRNLVSFMTDEDLHLQNLKYNTALCLAAALGNEKIARILVTRSRALLDIPDNQGVLPLSIAAFYGKYNMVKFLYDESNHMNDGIWEDRTRGWVLLSCVEADFYDIALKIVNNHPELSGSNDILAILARKTNAFSLRDDFNINLAGDRADMGPLLLNVIWTNIMRMPKGTIDDIIRGPADMRPQNDEATSSQVEAKTYSSQVLFIAAEMGNTRFIAELIRSYPDLIWRVNDSNQTIFHVAVSHRQEGIYNLIREIGMSNLVAPLIDVDGNNMLHLAAMNTKNKQSEELVGLDQQMRRELLWYKEVEGLLPPSYQEKRNNAGFLPHELFTKDHKDMMSARDKWMKDTASHCMVIAALIITIVFAVAFTVPGGYHQDKGTPFFIHHKIFIVFVISNAISLTLATFSILIFLAIFLTTPYDKLHFTEGLPITLILGLETLYYSIVAMLVTFSVSFFVLYDKKLIWVPIIITAMASVPVHYCHLVILGSMYISYVSSENLFKPKKPMLYL